MCSSMTDTGKKAAQLFTYLKELSNLRMTHRKKVTDYEQVLWFADVPRETGCHCVTWELWDREEAEEANRGDIWIEVHKPELRSAPEVPDELEPWLDEQQVEDASLESPELLDEIVQTSDPDPETGEEQTEIHSINDHPDVFEMWMNYVKMHWMPWAEENRRHQAIQRTYIELYAIYQRAEKLGEQYEVVVGVGFLQWRSPNSGEIRHPLLTLRAGIEFDGAKGIMTVGPPMNGQKPTLEIDMLETADRPGVQEQRKIQEGIDELDGDPWEGSALENVLKSLANGISSESRYDRSMSRPAQISDIAQLHVAPSLILRKRSPRTFVEYFSKIVGLIETDDAVPDAVRRLVEIVEDDGECSPPSRSSQPSVVDTELYFPLPANKEQRMIVQRIEQHRGVLVEGPPGTGKSHTIANLVSHFLAKGKRVLVTSETPRALEVLNELLPKEIRELCVVWLGSGIEARESLEKSVDGITQRQMDWDPDRAWRDLQELERRLDQTRREKATLRKDLTACREVETYQNNPFGAYHGTLQEIAVQVNKERQQYGWLLDRPASDVEPPVTPDELLELRRVDTAVTDDLIREIGMRHLPPDCLIPSDAFRQLIASEKHALRLQERTQEKPAYLGYQALRCLSSERRAKLLDILRSQVKSMDELGRHVYGWADRAAREIAADQDRVWRQLLEFTEEHLQALGDRRQAMSELHVVGLEGRDYAEVALHASELRVHLDGGKALGFFAPLRAIAVKRAWYLVTDVRVEGRPCKTVDALEQLLQWLEFARRLDSLAELWSPNTTRPEGSYACQLAAYEDLCEPLRDALVVHDMVQELKGLVAEIQDLASPRWHVREEVVALRVAIEAAEVEEGLREARRAFFPLESRIIDFLERGDAHPATESILGALRARDAVAYESAFASIAGMNEWVEARRRAADILHRLETVAPKMVAAYREAVSDESWDERFREFGAAWTWARADRWLEDKCSGDPEHLSKAIEQAEASEHDILKQLAALKAWQSCMATLGEAERMSLIAWMGSVKKIRGGGGRHAERYREEAREKLDGCRRAIPVWIMPLYQVVQTTTPQKGLFDIVIVDEASQSGPEALLLNYIAEKIIVVGDEKQIAPEIVGVNRDDVVRLRQMYLEGIPHSDAYDLEGSFFAQARLRFPGKVRLRDHFRCMPEIIEFSNRLSYSTEPLRPLRQFGAGRLEPLRTTHVVDGYRKGQSPNIVNDPEAKALVEQIVQCLEDEAYNGKTFGVVCLLGHLQAKQITNLLMQEVGAEEIERRQLLCGSPYDFQGNERDVIFLSMVDAPQDGKVCHMIRTERDRRKFNVAASRAKDQLWLFHTPTLNDLRTECLRHRLLSHCLAPATEQTVVGELRLEELRRLAASGVRDRTNAPPPFDSWFEVDVAVRIVERGYRVLAQHEVAGYRIDLVVEGLHGKLAVECDGDHWHGPEQYPKDQERERQLQRCKWTFSHVRGSQFYRDPAAALESLWESLDELEILPKHQWEQQRREHDGPRDTAEAYASADNDTLAPDVSSEGAPDPQPAPQAGDGPADQPTAARRPKWTGPLRDVPAVSIQEAIVSALKVCPHNTCTAKSMTKLVLRELGIITRGNPRAEFEKRVSRNLRHLVGKGAVQEYKATNKRLRLL